MSNTASSAAPAPVFCIVCGVQLDPNVQYCTSCGSYVGDLLKKAAKQAKSKPAEPPPAPIPAPPPPAPVAVPDAPALEQPLPVLDKTVPETDLRPKKSPAKLLIILAILLIAAAAGWFFWPKADIKYVQVFPQFSTVAPGAAMNFGAIVNGTGDTAVKWTLHESAGGKLVPIGAVAENGIVSQQAHYSAPDKPGVYHIEARCVADSSKFAVATVTVAAK